MESTIEDYIVRQLGKLDDLPAINTRIAHLERQVDELRVRVDELRDFKGRAAGVAGVVALVVASVLGALDTVIGHVAKGGR